jgi:hypothetical protein
VFGDIYVEALMLAWTRRCGEEQIERSDGMAESKNKPPPVLLNEHNQEYN